MCGHRETSGGSSGGNSGGSNSSKMSSSSSSSSSSLELRLQTLSPAARILCKKCGASNLNIMALSNKTMGA